MQSVSQSSVWCQKIRDRPVSAVKVAFSFPSSVDDAADGPVEKKHVARKHLGFPISSCTRKPHEAASPVASRKIVAVNDHQLLALLFVQQEYFFLGVDTPHSTTVPPLRLTTVP